MNGMRVHLASRAAAVAAGLLFIAAVVVAILSGDSLRYPDEIDYHAIALNLAHHGEFAVEKGVPTAIRPPGFPFILRGLYVLGEHPVLAKLLNAFALGITSLLLGRLALAGSRSKGAGAGSWIAPVLMLGYPLFLYTAGTLYPQIVGTALFAGVVTLLVTCPGRVGAGVLGGVLFGLLILIVPSFLLFAGLVPILCAWADWKSGFRWYARAPVMLAVAVALVVPWTIRNYSQFHAIIPVSANGGLNLLLGNSPNTTATSGVNVDISAYMKQTEEFTELGRDDFLKHCAVEYIKAHPGEAAWLYVRKVAGYFHFRNKLFTQGEGSVLRDLVMAASYYPLLLLAVGRLFWAKRLPLTITEVVIYVIYFGNALLSAIFFTRIRFRIPFDALLIVLAALAIELIVVEFRKRQGGQPPEA